MDAKQEFTKEQIDTAKKHIVNSFADETCESLFDVSLQIVTELRSSFDDNWMCLIKPSEMDVGAAYHY